MMIVVRKDLNMRKGKLAAQAGHACVEAILAALDKENRLGDIRMYGTHPTLKPSRKRTALTEWFENGVAKICVYVNSEQELLDGYFTKSACNRVQKALFSFPEVRIFGKKGKADLPRMGGKHMVLL